QVGIRFSLDDFGTGYSSLSNLNNLPVSHIKVDRSFVQDICSDSGDQAMVNSILAMSKHMGLKVVAEGVEMQQQFDLLKTFDCQYFQGYFFSKPLPCDEMETVLEGGQLGYAG
ncbi:MAG: EAL domain-containing protein, partial [Pseudomonadota bacterium]